MIFHAPQSSKLNLMSCKISKQGTKRKAPLIFVKNSQKSGASFYFLTKITKNKKIKFQS